MEPLLATRRYASELEPGPPPWEQNNRHCVDRGYRRFRCYEYDRFPSFAFHLHCDLAAGNSTLVRSNMLAQNFLSSHCVKCPSVIH